MSRIVVLASGGGTTLQAILDAFPPPPAPGPIVAGVICNTPGAGALDRARRAGVSGVLVDHRRRPAEAFENELIGALRGLKPDLVCLAGFLRILSPVCIRRLPGSVLNTHPALLPAFGGKGMYGERVHRAVLEAGIGITGCTIHVVNEIPDGGPIIAQVAVPVRAGDTPENLAARVQAEERRLYPEVIRWWTAGRLEVSARRVVWRALPEGGGS